MGTPSTDIGPGLGAFVAFFVLALLLWLLMRNMNGRMRRMAYTERERVARMEAREGGTERAAGTGAGTPGATAGAAAPDDDPATGPRARGDDDE